MVASESRMRVDTVGTVGSDKRSASSDAGRTGGIENRTAVGNVGLDRSVGDENRTAVGHNAFGRNLSDENRTAVGRNAPGRNVGDENRTAVGHEMHGGSEIAGANTRLETRTAVGHEVPVPADDGWSEEESKRLIENSRDNARIPSSGEERDRKASQVLESHGVLTDADLIGMREPPGLGLSNQARSSEGMSTGMIDRGMTSPIDIRGILNAIPDFTGVPNPVPQKLPDIHSLFDGVTSGRARGERRRDDQEGQGPNPRTETPTSR